MKAQWTRSWFFAGVLLVLSLVDAAAGLPRSVDTRLAGANLLKSPPLKAYDARTGYYLWVEHESDGASNTIFIAPNPDLFHRPKHRVEEYRAMSFPLTTGQGIKVGDRLEQIYRELGRPNTTQYHNILGQKRRVDIYKHHNGQSARQRRQYEAVYVSDRKRIQGIRFSYYRGTW